MQKTWFISDIHFFHYNIIKYTDRPFSSVEEMHRIIIENWNATINPNDKVFIVGDFTFGDPEKSKIILSKLNGYKILIRGNHDKSPDKMKEMGFNEVYEHYIIELDNKRIFLNHYPYRPKNPEEANLKKMNKRPEDKGHWLIHGHVHQHWKQKGRMINVSVEVWNYFPVSVDQILELINNGENNIPDTPENYSEY